MREFFVFLLTLFAVLLLLALMSKGHLCFEVSHNGQPHTFCVGVKQ